MVTMFASRCHRSTGNSCVYPLPPRIWIACSVTQVGAENCVTLCDLGIFVDQAAEPVPTLNVQCWFRRVDGCRVPKLRRTL